MEKNGINTEENEPFPNDRRKNEKQRRWVDRAFEDEFGDFVIGWKKKNRDFFKKKEKIK